MTTDRESIAAYVATQADKFAAQASHPKFGTEFVGQAAAYRALASDIRAGLDIVDPLPVEG